MVKVMGTEVPVHGPAGMESVPLIILAVPSVKAPRSDAIIVTLESSIPARTSTPAINPVSEARMFAELRVHAPPLVKVADPLTPKLFGVFGWDSMSEIPMFDPPAVNDPV